MKTICLIIILILLSRIEAKPQEKSFFLNAKIEKLDTTEYYLVIKAIIIKDKSEIIILSSMDENPNFAIQKDSSIVQVGKVYRFYVQPTDRIKSSKDSYLLLHFQNLFWQRVLMAQEGKFAYIALNMFKGTIFN